MTSSRSAIGGAIPRKAALQHVNRIFHLPALRYSPMESLRDGHFLRTHVEDILQGSGEVRKTGPARGDDPPTSLSLLSCTGDEKTSSIKELEAPVSCGSEIHAVVLEDNPPLPGSESDESKPLMQASPLLCLVPCEQVPPSCSRCQSPLQWTDLGRTTLTLSIGSGALLCLCPACVGKSFFSLK